MRYLLLVISILFIKQWAFAQVDFKTWKEDIRHKSDPNSNISYDSTIIIEDSEQLLSFNPRDINITIDYCKKLITANYTINKQAVHKEYKFDKCGIESWKQDKAIYFSKDGNNEEFYRYIEYDKSKNQLKIIEEVEMATRSVSLFYGKELKIEELGAECKLFYDEPLDTNLYQIDLSRLDGKWIDLNENETVELEISLSPKYPTDELYSICNVSVPTKGVSGEIQITLDQSDVLFWSFYTCISEKYEIRMQLEFDDGTADDVYIRKLTDDELIIDYTSYYVIYKRQK